MKEKIIELFNIYKNNNQKYTFKSFAKEVGCSAGLVYKVLTKENLIVKKRSIKEDLPNIIKDYKSGVNITNLHLKYGFDQKNISERLKENGIEVKNECNYKYNSTIKHDYFEKIDNQNKAYVLGMMYSDGNVRKNRNMLQLCLQKRDVEILDFIKSEISPITKVYTDRENYLRIALSSKKLKEDIIKLGCIPDKTHFLTFPTEQQVPKELLPHFIRGYFDGDGSVGRHTISFTGKDTFLLEIHKYFELEKSIRFYIRHPERNNNISTSFYTGKQMYKITRIIYKDANFFLKRKFNKINKTLQKKYD